MFEVIWLIIAIYLYRLGRSIQRDLVNSPNEITPQPTDADHFDIKIGRN